MRPLALLLAVLVAIPTPALAAGVVDIARIDPGAFHLDGSPEDIRWSWVALESEGGTSWTPSPSSPLCDPAWMGALPDDGVDDTDGINAALRVGDVCLRAGTYHLTKKGRASVVVPSGRRLRGAGARDSRMVMTGSGSNGAWTGILVQGDGVYLGDFTASAEETHDTEEQTHVIGVQGPSTGTQMARLRVTHPPRQKPGGGRWPGGDCVRLLGQVGQVVRDTLLYDMELYNCDRAGLQVQREVERTKVIGVTFTGTGDADIDVEATGTGRVDDLMVQGCTASGGEQGTYAFTIQCTTGICSNVNLIGNMLHGRGVYMFNVQGAVAIGNIIHHRATTIEPSFWISKRSRNITLAINTIDRLGIDGPLVAVKDHNSGAPSDVDLRGNTLEQGTAGPLLHLRGATTVSMSDNTITRVLPGVLALAERSSVPTSGLRIERNDMAGAFTAMTSGPIQNAVTGHNVILGTIVMEP